MKSVHSKLITMKNIVTARETSGMALIYGENYLYSIIGEMIDSGSRVTGRVGGRILIEIFGSFR